MRIIIIVLLPLISLIALLIFIPHQISFDISQDRTILRLDKIFYKSLSFKKLLEMVNSLEKKKKSEFSKQLEKELPKKIQIKSIKINYIAGEDFVVLSQINGFIGIITPLIKQTLGNSINSFFYSGKIGPTTELKIKAVIKINLYKIFKTMLAIRRRIKKNERLEKESS